MPHSLAGLEDQLLGRVILTEKKELETERTQLIADVTANNRKIKELEENLLHKLGTVQVRTPFSRCDLNQLTLKCVESITLFMSHLFPAGPSDRRRRINVGIKYHEADSGGNQREAEHRERHGVEN